jgi:hypothetical protein
LLKVAPAATDAKVLHTWPADYFRGPFIPGYLESRSSGTDCTRRSLALAIVRQH